MPFPHKSFAWRAALRSGAAVVLLSVAACAPATNQPPTGTATTAPAAGAVPSAHVHGIAVNGESNQILLATHDGLFDVTSSPARKIGATNDLMGFTAGPTEGVFYASGHPGPGSDLPNPMGLLKSSDGGETWEQLSRQGESDFHAMTTTQSGIVAFDGQLQSSADGRSWTRIAADFSPAGLAGHPGGTTVLATTPKGIQRSTDAGTTWKPVTDGPVIQFAAFLSPGEAVGVEPDGTVHHSSDAGETWLEKGRIDAEVMAIASTLGGDGTPWIWAATPTGVLVSTDGGVAFGPAKNG